ncbi:UNVERIFIED_CONTAM: hypothetical protein FKN15_023342 [Acipenser sinensis]
MPINNTVLKLMCVLQPSSHSTASSGDIVQLAMLFPQIVLGNMLDSLEMECMQYQVTDLTDLRQDLEADENWHRIALLSTPSREPCFAALAKLAMNMLALPHSTAELEQVFSQMNLVKTDVRNQLDRILTFKTAVKNSTSFRLMKQMIQSAIVSMYDYN